MSELSIHSYEEMLRWVPKKIPVNFWAVIVEGASDYRVFGCKEAAKKYAQYMSSKTDGHFIVLKSVCGYFKHGD